MLRGSGLAGLAGILPATREGLMRPLLDVSRAEIEEFLRGRGIPWREDASNRDEGFARNRIRHSLLPQLAREWNPEIATALARLADTAHEEERWWWDRIERLAEQVLVEEAGGLEIEAGRLARMPRATSRRLVRCAVARSGAGPRPAADPLVGLVGRGKSRTGGSVADQGVRPTQADQVGRAGQAGGQADQTGRAGQTGATHLDFDAVERVLDLAAAQAGSGTLDLGGGVRVMRSFDRMRFVNAGSGALPEPVAVTIPGRHEWNGTRVCLDVADAAPESAGCVRLKVTEGASAAPLMLRGWRAGDHYHPAGHLRDQNIKEMFQQARVPSWQRGFWPILCQGTEILWARQFGAAAERAACSSEPAVWVWEEKVSKA
jgi:tRNA(Ile)-lysidine synthetase-like protein